MDGSSKVIREHPVQKATTVIDEDKNKSAQRAELQVFPYVWVITNSCAVANGLPIWLHPGDSKEKDKKKQ